ncbi:hypothetical protein IWW39_000238 [Coemansia spiralis]|uniref:Uncharacterized protein n=1 Tax=Coemansia spiralis TaxID=417178 RepID=A0A9W8GPM3_9FUNG|nr:hypothetical protein IWW39_000238 [Coemansia spiralis]
MHWDEVTLNVRPITSGLARSVSGRKNNNVESRMDKLIRLYESVAEQESVRGAVKMLRVKNIIYYNAEKKVGASNFDKRSSEGKAIIQAKRVVQRQKLLTQRGHSIDAKRRELSIGMSRLELQGY